MTAQTFEIEKYENDIINIVIEHLEQNDISLDALSSLDEFIHVDDDDYKTFISTVEDVECRVDDLETTMSELSDLDARDLQKGLDDIERIAFNFLDKGEDMFADLNERIDETDSLLKEAKDTIEQQRETIEELTSRISALEKRVGS